MPKDMLIDELTRISQAASGQIGIAALHLETGVHVSVNGAMLFPMASTYKVPIAAYLFHLIDQNRLSLDRMIAVERRNLVSSSIISTYFRQPGISLSLYNLIELMLTESDNTATDVVIGEVGGSATVTGWLRSIGIDRMRVDRTTAELLRQYAGMPAPTGEKESFLDQYEDLRAKGRHEIFELDGSSPVYIAFEKDPQDQATPDAMVELLEKIWREKIFSAHGVELLRGVMGRCKTGAARLSGRMPAGVLVAHKSGTIAGTVNDVGYITLPNRRGHIAIAVFIKAAVGPREDHEVVIADIARTVYDYFMQFVEF